ncbi:peptidoglycan DD-metalloendopeptidase family protein [Muribaculum intestinale]|uniref:peptidoglycan DD-metalloendopeptidase family protein n=1 Tax=Muribaculum intestinale TaxID=1796646 RepID=UPI0024BB2C5D|nr:peptidoglycan DD-metalloendopeptidase family protein [Muribaculum intestinale]
MSVLSALSQGRHTDILSVLIGASSENIDSASFADNTPVSQSPLEILAGYIGNDSIPTSTPAALSDTIVYFPEHDDLYAALSDLSSACAESDNSRQGTGGYGSLDFISGAYSSYGFYQSGSCVKTKPYTDTYSLVPPISGVSYYSPEWGRITSGFGYREKFNRVHKGIDIAMEIGDTVRVALPGIVDKVSYEAHGYGHYVEVVHDNGIATCYAHLSSSLVKAGDKVDASQPIALSGNTGNSTGPHLHFETRYNGTAINPITVFNFYDPALTRKRRRL